PADATELEQLVRNKRQPTVLTVEAYLLERDGQRIVTQSNRVWSPGKGETAKRWLELLAYE
ncbi:MAG: hypothetical protein FWF84_06710, partial [Kiritimatiellaeota bacterium]|nr:hypothetical protein [Kiritimatiellota bacterium]